MRKLIEYARWGDLGVIPYLHIGSRQQIRGPHLRIGRFRFGWDHAITRYKVESVGDGVHWSFYFYYDSKRNTYVGDRTIYHGPPVRALDDWKF